MSSSYESEDMEADKLQAGTNLINEGDFLAKHKAGVVTSLKDEGALKVAVPETLPKDVVDDQLPKVGMKSIFKKVLKCLKKGGGGGGGGGEEEEEDYDDHYGNLYRDDDDDDDDYNEEEDDDVGIIGVYGMGGVGKTTLLTEIKKKLLQMKNDFDVVIWVVDLQHDKIQQQIVEQIGLFDKSLFDKKVWEDTNFEDKASDIFKILKDKKFVLLMDGLWERVDLTKVGVPLPGPENSSKIVFSTRSLQICSLMEADKLFKVKRLRYSEAWKLFKALVGDETLGSHLDVRDLARNVCRECRGLPLALVSIGRTMASKESPEEWRDVLGVLRRSTTSYPGLDDQFKKDIRDNLKLSYDNLQNDMFKSCFLYCCLFPRDREIKKRDLIDFWIGEGFLDERLGAVQSRGHYIIDVFLSVCLLEQSGKDDSSVKMHYWIHDMSLWIASKIETEKGNCFFCTDTDILTDKQVTENLKKATRMSLRGDEDEVIVKQPDPLLGEGCPLLQTLFLIHNGSVVISEDAFFNVLPLLKVLNLSHNSILTKLTGGISNLISLQHLDLSWTGIQDLPKELRALKKLKCLNLENTRSLRKIPLQLISEFSVLHVLRLWECGFMLQSNEECNDAQLLIEELLCLKNLSMLSITLNNSHALQRLLSSNRLRSCIQSLCLRDLSHPKSIKVPLTDLKHLNTLEISKCDYLGELEVDFVGEAQAVRESPPSFYFLDKVIIKGCPKLRDLTWLILAPNLKLLEISDCDEMEEIINVGKLSECPELMGNVNPFSKLKIIRLEHLRKLRSIYWTDLPFPDLEAIPDIRECLMLPPHQVYLLLDSWISRKISTINKMELYVTEFPLISGSIYWIAVPSERFIHSLKLKEFHVQGGDYGGKACSLEYFLNNFGHIESLWIIDLATGIDENIVQLKYDKSIRVLGLGFSGSNSKDKDEAFLEAFQPPPNLQELIIDYYRGTTMSTLRRMTSLTNLRSIKLLRCIKCLHMPPLGKLPFLETLVIHRMDSVREVGNEFLGVESGEASSSSSSITYFPKLQTLSFEHMEEWEVWDFGNEDDTCTIMPFLHSLKFEHCKKLKGLPKQLLAPLQNLEIYVCHILKEVYSEGKGDKWQDISHIPNIKF